MRGFLMRSFANAAILLLCIWKAGVNAHEDEQSSLVITTPSDLQARTSCINQGKHWCFRSRQCISTSFLCNGLQNCIFGEDELSCLALTTPSEHVQRSLVITTPSAWSIYLTVLEARELCRNQGNYSCVLSHKCISTSLLCDGRRDCSFGEDEESCPVTTTPSVLQESTTCRNQGRYWCAISRRCIATDWLCDGQRDCSFEEDEQNCTNVTVKPWSGGAIGPWSGGAIAGLSVGLALGIILFTIITLVIRRRVKHRSRLHNHDPRQHTVTSCGGQTAPVVTGKVIINNLTNPSPLSFHGIVLQERNFENCAYDASDQPPPHYIAAVNAFPVLELLPDYETACINELTASSQRSKPDAPSAPA